jgi:hypothetical protein
MVHRTPAAWRKQRHAAAPLNPPGGMAHDNEKEHR